MADQDEIVRSIFGVHKIKYKILDNLNIDKLNTFHINLTTILNFVMKHYPDLASEKEYLYVIVSQVINLIAHYRHYFIKIGLDPDFYIYSNDCDGRFKDTLRLLKVIIQYVPRVYMIKTNSIPTSTAMLYITEKYKHNIILTKSKADVLLVTKNISVLKSNKDKTLLYNSDNVYSNFTKKDYTGNISYKLLPIFYALTGLIGNQIKGLGPAKVLKLMNKGLENHSIVNDYYYDIDHFLSDMEGILSLNDIDLKTVKDNFGAVSNILNYKKYLTPIVRKKIDNSIIDKFAKNDLKELNIKYFTGLDSLMLEELFEQINQDKRSIRW